MNTRTALATHRITLASMALLAPRTAGRLFGLDYAAQPQGAVTTRLMASRNLVLGVGLALSTGEKRRLMTKLNAAVDVIDLACVVSETRRRAIPPRATLVGGLTAGSGAVLSQLAARG